MFTIESSRSARESRSLTWTGILPETPGRRIGQGAPATADERPWRPRTGRTRRRSGHAARRADRPASPSLSACTPTPSAPAAARAGSGTAASNRQSRKAPRPRTHRLGPTAQDQPSGVHSTRSPPPVCGPSRRLRCSACPTAVVVPLSAQLPRHGKPGVGLASFSSARRRSFSMSMLDLPSSASISS